MEVRANNKLFPVGSACKERLWVEKKTLETEEPINISFNQSPKLAYKNSS